MTINLGNAATVFTVLAGLTTILGFGFVLLRYVIRAETAELRNNGGSTIKDAVDRIDKAARVAAEKANEAAAVAAETKAALDKHVHQSAELLEQGRASEAEIRDLIQHGQDEDAEIRATIAKLADAVAIAAQSTPPKETP